MIIEEFKVTEDGEYKGWIEVIDGRWGASLTIDPSLDEGDDALTDPILRYGEVLVRGNRDWPAPDSTVWEALPERIPRLLVYDLWKDPKALHSIHAERPDLVAKYTEFLLDRFREHVRLGQRLSPAAESPLTPEQLETLRTLGYVQ